MSMSIGALNLRTIMPWPPRDRQPWDCRGRPRPTRPELHLGRRRLRLFPSAAGGTASQVRKAPSRFGRPQLFLSGLRGLFGTNRRRTPAGRTEGVEGNHDRAAASEMMRHLLVASSDAAFSFVMPPHCENWAQASPTLPQSTKNAHH